MKGICLWITGLPGSGKSTIADAVKERFPEFVILRMDELRRLVTPEPTYSEEEREIVYRTFVYVAKTLTGLGHSVIMDATGNRRSWRELARKEIKGFIEIYLKCPLNMCMAREKERLETHGAPKEIYDKGRAGWPVPGIAAPYEEPLNPELIIDTDVTGIKEAVDLIDALISRR